MGRKLILCDIAIQQKAQNDWLLIQTDMMKPRAGNVQGPRERQENSKASIASQACVKTQNARPTVEENKMHNG